MRQSDDNHIPMDQIGAPGEPVRLHLPADFRYLRLLRLVASSMAADLGFPVDELEEVRVAVDELGSALLADGIRGGIDVELSTSRRTLHVRASAATTSAGDGSGGGDLVIDPIARELLVILADDVQVSTEDGRHIIELTRALRSGPS